MGPKRAAALPPAPAPSAPPLSPVPVWGDEVSSVDVYALPLARPVPFSPPPLPLPLPPPLPLRPPPLPPRSSDTLRHRPPHAHSRRLGVHTEQNWCPSVWPALWFASHLMVYHIANASLAIAAAAVVLLGLALALALLPLCGFGVVVLGVALRSAYYFSEFDAKAHNTLVTTDAERIMFPEDDEHQPLLPVYNPRRATATTRAPSRPRFARDALRHVSPRALLLLVYFGVVKLVLGLLSVVCLTSVIVFSLALVSENTHIQIQVGKPTNLTLDTSTWNAVENLVAASASAVGLHVLARVSLAATRYFCCERR